MGKSERAAELVRQRGAWMLFLPPYSPDLNPCMDGSCGSRCRIGFGEQVGCGHVYGVYMCNEVVARPDEYPLGEQVPLNRARSRRFGLIGVSWFFVSVCSPSPHFALTIPRACQAAAA
ncbi:hypothetical protein [Pontitalea aquivivens]|uniref:hypothetical protein n=1 Tax=Pontitalea aquivivens TaxID=3388663 RepID=UPI003970FCB1